MMGPGSNTQAPLFAGGGCDWGPANADETGRANAPSAAHVSAEITLGILMGCSNQSAVPQQT